MVGKRVWSLTSGRHSMWRPASVEAPVAGVDTLAHPENSGFPTGADAAPGGRCDRFSTIEKRRRECAGCRAQSARMSESDVATAQATLGIQCLVSGACTHVAQDDDETDFRLSRNVMGRATLMSKP
jgi:hypothetical protein